MTRSRAINEDQRAARRMAILDAARAALTHQPLEAVTMAGIARASGLAKGTLYLYFDTREALFLTLVEEELSAWFDAVDAGLSDVARDGHDAVATLLGRSIAGQPLLPRLIAVLHTVLECNIDFATARAFKSWLFRRSLKTGASLEDVLGFLEPGAGMTLLLRVHALAIGFQHAANPAPVVREVIAHDPALDVFSVDFVSGLTGTLRLLLAGWSQQENNDE